ncbi:riboflavin transporter 2-like isoform X1 [Lampetra planeri]
MAWPVHALTCVFGVASWVAINGMWVELPVIVPQIPEGWYLPSYLTVLIQLANVGPLAITLAHRFRPGCLDEVPLIYAILALGAVACLLLAFLWDRTTVIAGADRSTALLALTFFLSLVDCTSSVTFLPFMMRLQPGYMTSYYVGEGLSGLLPGLVALGQGAGFSTCVNVSIADANGTAGDNGTSIYEVQTEYRAANFSPRIFFLILCGMMAASMAAFVMLNHLPLARREYSHEGLQKLGSLRHGEVTVAGPREPSQRESNGASLEPSALEATHTFDVLDSPSIAEYMGLCVGRTDASSCRSLSRLEFVAIFLILAWANGLTNGVLPSVQSYSCLPYGNTAYHLSATLAALANPIACFVAVFKPSRSQLVLSMLTLLGSVFGAYILAMAVMSPCPLLLGTDAGTILIVLAWVLFTGALSYVKVMVGVVLRDQGHSALLFCGAVEQLGSAVGALAMFPLVNVYGVFTAGEPCGGAPCGGA